jgi:hypothetical protein
MLCHAPVPLDARHADSLNVTIPAQAGIDLRPSKANGFPLSRE